LAASRRSHGPTSRPRTACGHRGWVWTGHRDRHPGFSPCPSEARGTTMNACGSYCSSSVWS
jgi:hypothetical protein